MLFMIESNYHVWCDSITKIFMFLSYFIDKNSLVFVFLFDMANTILLNYFSKFCFVLCNDIKFKVKIETLCGKQNIWNIQWNITSNLLQNNLWTNKLWILRFCRIVYYACFFLFFVLFCCCFFLLSLFVSLEAIWWKWYMLPLVFIWIYWFYDLT